MGAQKNRILETVLLSTHNICFGWETTESFFIYILLSTCTVVLFNYICFSTWDFGTNNIYQASSLIWFFTSQPTIFQLCPDGSSLVKPVLSKEKCVLLKDTTHWRRWGLNPRPLCFESSTLQLSHCAPITRAVKALVSLRSRTQEPCLQKRVCLKIIFLISQSKYMLWVLKRTISIRWSFWAPKTYS